MREEFGRTAALIGQEAVERLQNSRVAVFGLGGVGSYAAEALARAGVGKLILVDHDIVSLSNINRQLIALHTTVGQPKAEVMRQRILDINPAAQVEARLEFYPSDAGDSPYLHCNYLVDAIDTISSKLKLAELANQHHIPIISAMGCGNKLDACRFEVADITQTSVCPLCRVMRRELRGRGIAHLKVVYSKEPPRNISLAEEGVTRHIPASISFVPGAAGLVLAGEVIKDITQAF